MKGYNPKEWFSIIFLIQKSDTLVKLGPFMVIIFIYTLGIAWLEMDYLQLGKESWVQHIPVMHSLLSFVISMLLVFRTNTAYDRWWEGRKLWGQLVNNSRNLALKLAGIIDKQDEENRKFFRRSIPMYAFALKEHLQSKVTFYMLDEKHIADLQPEIDMEKHVPNQVAKMMFGRVNKLYQSKKITGDQLIVLNSELISFTDICGACERIKNTPIPYSYSSFIKKFIMLYVLTLPLGYVFNLGYYAAPIVTFVFYVLASLELVAEEIEEPFGHDANDLPMGKLSENIQKHVQELI
ncbi:bestrophin family protein [Algoriphagus halophytocola]|uniref:Bestrophin family protein n=1 Tax=Algoriphagus halophytocola TaxID=2991499 RepID=A0ABY6MG22_9BACT|nr:MULTISPECIES: bestrophin family protein [unclassified Algoriphagus]UZD21910.1 bestrophin family protein [Algoriphagus sp. TR-M5]WBL43160.1 bestrophin family protein [Algoriphagus sp. TR-M9]